jgi:hypothetical protein
MEDLPSRPDRARYYCSTGPEFSKIHEDRELRFLCLSPLPVLVGITGPPKAGKTMVAKHLVTQMGFYYASLSSLLQEKATSLGIAQPSWRDLSDIALTWRAREGNAVLVHALFDRLLVNDVLRARRAIVIDGVLHPDEMSELLSKPRFVPIAIIASRRRRYDLAASWFGAEGVVSWDEFVERDRWELGVEQGPAHPLGAPDVRLCIRLIPRENRFAFKGDEKQLVQRITCFLQSVHPTW